MLSPLSGVQRDDGYGGCHFGSLNLIDSETLARLLSRYHAFFGSTIHTAIFFLCFRYDITAWFRSFQLLLLLLLLTVCSFVRTLHNFIHLFSFLKLYIKLRWSGLLLCLNGM